MQMVLKSNVRYMRLMQPSIMQIKASSSIICSKKFTSSQMPSLVRSRWLWTMVKRLNYATIFYSVMRHCCQVFVMYKWLLVVPVIMPVWSQNTGLRTLSVYLVPSRLPANSAIAILSSSIILWSSVFLNLVKRLTPYQHYVISRSKHQQA